MIATDEGSNCDNDIFLLGDADDIDDVEVSHSWLVDSAASAQMIWMLDFFSE